MLKERLPLSRMLMNFQKIKEDAPNGHPGCTQALWAVSSDIGALHQGQEANELLPCFCSGYLRNFDSCWVKIQAMTPGGPLPPRRISFASQLSDDEKQFTTAAVYNSGLAAINRKQRSSQSNTVRNNKISGGNSKDNPTSAALAKFSSSLCNFRWSFRDKAHNCVSPISWQRN